MGRLRSLPSRLRSLPPVLASAKVDGVRRAAAEADWRAWYKTKRWQQLRWQVLVEALFTCAMCKRVEGVTRNLVADHKEPHRGDAALFWDRRNLQCLCAPCHASAKQREELRGAGRR